jgi:NitT/TauT family transport system permease protein
MPADTIDAQRDTTAGLDALELAPVRRGPSRGRRVWRGAWPKLLAVGLVIAVWQIVVWSGWKEAYVLPGPGAVFEELGSLVTTC